MSRRAARLAAVEVLYAADIRSADPANLVDDGITDEYARHLVLRVTARRDELDALVGRYARGWPTDRMSPVDRNVLRVGALELLEGDVPPAAAIDEAVDIAKHFSGEEAGRFVNGVLEAVRQGLSDGGGDACADGGSSAGGTNSG